MASAGGQQPTSFKTNVNRAKTKRWVEAKSYTYDGDDWGDADEYDEYGGYDDAPTPSKPTGLRQQGQSAGSVTPSLYGSPTAPQQRGSENIRPGQPQQQYGLRSATNPQPRITTDLGRSNSFDRGDEKRAFSAGGSQFGITSPNAPAYVQLKQGQPYNTPNVPSPTQFSPNQMRQVQPDVRQAQQQRPMPEQRDRSVSHSSNVYSLPASHRGPHPYEEPSQPSQPTPGSRAQSMTSNTPSLDVHNRRDLTPSALPPPLQPQGHSLQDTASMSQRPPRSSSLSQTTQPSIPKSSQNIPSEMSSEVVLLRRERTSSNADKPLPFVRPADIYKRMQEEKQRQRQSQESSRPSMDTISAGQDYHDSTIHPALREEQPNDSDLGTGATSSQFYDTMGSKANSGTATQHQSPAADDKSDHDFNQGNMGNHPTDDRRTAPPHTTSSSSHTPQASFHASQSPLLPVLPEVARMSTFGESFLSTSAGKDEHELGPVHSSSNSGQPSVGPATTAGGSPTELQHHPSSGFRSVVNQAFDVNEDQIPPTPSSTIGRSTSGGTSMISPIISRGPSTSKPDWDSKDVAERPMTSPVAEEPESSATRPLSSESAGTSRQVINTTRSEGAPLDRKEPSPASFIPGHRRDLSTPSPNNSPARTPALESNLQVRQPQEAELAVATPTDPEFGSRISPTREQTSRDGREPSFVAGARDRNDVSKQGKVRNLAGKFESASSSRRGSDQSPTRRPGQLVATSQRPDLATSTRPPGDRTKSFRPHLPGAWESYASNAPFVASNESLDDDRRGLDDRQNKAQGALGNDDEIHMITKKPHSPDTPTQAKHTERKQEDPQDDPFASVLAAGSALANAFAAAAGLDNDSSKEPASNDGKAIDAPDKSIETARSRSTSVNTALHPEAARPPVPSTRDDDDASSIAPTPPLKDPPLAGKNRATADYFPHSNTLESHEYGTSSEQSTPLSRPPMPPMLSTLSTDTGSVYESDRLRREIMRDLAPNAHSEPTTAESDSPYQNEPKIPSNQSPQVHPAARESMVLPREYDKYWDDASSASSSQSGSRKGTGVGPIDPAQVLSSAMINQDQGTHATNDTRNGLTETVPESDATRLRPTLVSHRFSWEQSSQGQHSTTETLQKPLSTLQTPPHVHDSPELGRINTEGPFSQQAGLSDSPTARESIGKDFPAVNDGKNGGLQNPSIDHKSPLPATVGKTEATGFLPEKQNVHEPLDSINRGNDHMPVETSQQNAQRDAYDPQIGTESNAMADAGADNSIPPPSASTNTQPKIPAFREILALKSPAERIRGYNEAREQFANLESGLSHWVAVTSSELPEHGDVLANVNRPPAAIMGHKPSSSRLLSGLRSSGPQQHFLNSNARPGASTSDGGNTLSLGSSPPNSGSKISSQQVQAKGKDLLHTAGVFGGKANVAAKGLFSKGRSRLKEARGSDKDPTPPSSPVTVPSGIQPQTQPPLEVSTRNVTFDHHQTQSITAVSERPERFHGNPPDGSGTDERLAQEDLPREDDASLENDRANCSERNNLHPSRTSTLQTANETKLASSRDEAVVLNNLDGRKVCDSLPEGLLVVGHDHGTPTPTQDARSNSSGPKTLTGNDSTTYDLSESLSQSPYVHHHRGAQSYPLRDAGSIIAPNKQSQATSVSTPPSRSAAVRVDTIDTAAHPHSEGPASSQCTTKKVSGDSNRTFQTAEEGNPSRPGSECVQENIETPKAEKSRILGTETGTWSDQEDGSPTARLPSTTGASEWQVEDMAREQTANPPTEHLPPFNQAHYEPSGSQKDYLTREPSLDNVPTQVDSDRSPSPVSPQLSIHNEPLRRQSTREPIYYGPQHDFGTKQTHDPALRRQRSHPSSRGHTGLQDHPAFRSAQDMNVQEQDKALGRETMNMPGQSLSGYLPDETRSSTNQIAETKSKSNRNSRNSGFFKNIGNSVKVGVPSIASPADMQAPPSSTTTSNENVKRSKRGSLFRPRPGDKGSDGAPSIGSSLAPGPAAGAETLQQSCPSTSESSRHDEPSKATSGKSRKDLQRASTSENQAIEGGGKKKRFSALTSLFGSRSSRAQPSRTMQANPTQSGSRAHFAPPQQAQHQNAYPARRPPAAQASHQPMSGPNQGHVGSSDYNAPVRSDTLTSQVPNPVWNQAAGRVSQARQSSTREPSAYLQDSSLRQRAASPSNPGDVGSALTSTSFAPNVSSANPAMKQRTSIFSRSKSRESSISGGNRDSSAKSWITGRGQDRPDLRNNSFNRPSQHNSSSSTQDPQRVLTFSQFGDNHIASNRPQEQQIAQSRKADQLPQPASNPRPPRTTSLGIDLPSEGAPRVLTFNQSGENHIAESSSRIPPATASGQGSVVQGKQPNVVTFQQFPSTSKAQLTSRGDSPPPPPPKDDWHVSKPRQSSSQNTGPESRERPQDSLNRPSITAQPYDPSPNPRRTSQPQPEFRAQQRQAPPPIQTEIPSSRLSAFSADSSSAESCKGRQRELEVAVPSTEKETAVAPAKQHDASSEENIVMSSSSYPGQEWQPSFAYDD